MDAPTETSLDGLTKKFEGISIIKNAENSSRLDENQGERQRGLPTQEVSLNTIPEDFNSNDLRGNFPLKFLNAFVSTAYLVLTSQGAYSYFPAAKPRTLPIEAPEFIPASLRTKEKPTPSLAGN